MVEIEMATDENSEVQQVNLNIDRDLLNPKFDGYQLKTDRNALLSHKLGYTNNTYCGKILYFRSIW